jgi:hypothetical protein
MMQMRNDACRSLGRGSEMVFVPVVVSISFRKRNYDIIWEMMTDKGRMLVFESDPRWSMLGQKTSTSSQV